MLVVTGLSLFVLLYVATGEAKRGYEEIHLDKVSAQGRLVRNSIERFLREELPLQQYVGFTTLAAPLLEAEEVDAIGVYDHLGRRLFFAIDKTNPKLPEPSQAITRIKENIQIEYGETEYQVIIPLRTRFETVGSVVVFSPTRLVTNRIHASFDRLPFIAAGLTVAFALVVMFVAPHRRNPRTPWLQIGYATIFMVVAGLVVFTLASLYYDVIQAKAKASAITLAQRLNDIGEFKLDFKDIGGLDNALKEYRRLNTEISEAAVVVDDQIAVATNDRSIGRHWLSDPRNFEYTIDLSHENAGPHMSLTVTVPGNVVYERVARSVKNFAALFIASAFLSGLFFQVAASLQRLRTSQSLTRLDPKETAAGEALLTIIKPIFFLAVFLDALTYSFLPKFMQDAATASGISVGFASLPFTAYYMCFALSLIPSGSYADRYGPRPVIIVGLLLAGASVLGLMLPIGIGGMTALRAVSGIGQGMLFIGVQTFILAVTPPAKKTQGAAIIVFGFQGGLISGMALGSLMVNFVHPQGIFAVAGAVALASTLYTVWLIPNLAQTQDAKGSLGTSLARLGADLSNVVTSGEFLKTILCIGIPAKAILTGTITFALPLLLGEAQYPQEDIGQIIMLYGLAVVASSGNVSRLVDRTGDTERILFWGAVLSGAGLLLVGLMGSSLIGGGLLSTTSIIIGVMIVGVAHGFINAPVVTHVSHSHLAERIGVNPVTTTYRFLERIGHVAGPFVISQLFLLCGQTPLVVAGIGIGTIVLGLLFIARHMSGQLRIMEPAR
ncbi:MAG TPA: MFS transporter [Xanthobacteraceae bacterium]|nr:MFS transporter [Xanthobacteraceae bacterium]